MTADAAPSEVGAFLQVIEYSTDRPAEMRQILTRWLAAIGADRTARWYVTASDRDRPGVFLQFVEFPTHEDAMRNSDHPATADFATGLKAISGQDVTFRNLDVVAVECL